MCSTDTQQDTFLKHPYRFIPGEKGPGMHWIGGWVDPRAGLHTMEKRKPSLAGNLTQAIHPVARRYTGRAIMALAA
jgi:hypothetical protein